MKNTESFYICVCVYVCIYIYTYTYTYICIFANVCRAIKPCVVHWQWIANFTHSPFQSSLVRGDGASVESTVWGKQAWKVRHKNTGNSEYRNICHVLLLKGQVAVCWKLHGFETGMYMIWRPNRSNACIITPRKDLQVCNTWVKGRDFRIAELAGKAKRSLPLSFNKPRANFYTASLKIVSHLSITGFKIIKYP